MTRQPPGQTDGWSFFDAAPAPGPADPDELDRRIARVFTSPDGAAVLAWLRSVTIEQPAWAPGQDPSHGFAREGQDSVVREIEARMRRALSGPAPSAPLPSGD